MMAFTIRKWIKFICFYKFSLRLEQLNNDFRPPVLARALCIPGLWPYNLSWSLCSLSVLTSLFVIFGEVGAVGYYWPDVASECNIVGIFITGFRTVFVSLLMALRVEKFATMLSTFVEKIWISKNENKEAHMIAEKAIVLLNLGNFSLIMALVFYLIIPLIQMNEEGNKSFPYLIIYPFETQSPIIYCIIYIICVIAGIAAVATVTGHDTLMNYLLLHTCMRLRMLSLRIEHMGDEFTQGSKELETFIDKEFKKITELHREIISFTYKMEELFSPHILMHFIGTSVLICMLGVQMLLVKLTFAERTKIILYFITCLGQLFASCINGDKLIENSSYIAKAVYHFKWQDVSIKYKANILLMMQRAQRPLKLTAGKFFDLSMDTFNSVLKTSISYFALLKQLLEEH